MPNRWMPTAMWDRGRKIEQQDNVQVIAIDQETGMIDATVYGTYAYGVQVGADPQDDYCSCPYFPEHGFCKHIAAVVMYFKSRGQTIEEALGVDALAGPTVGEDTSGADFLADLDLPTPQYFHGLDADLPALTLEVSLEVRRIADSYWQKSDRFFIRLRIADAREQKFYVVRNAAEFLGAYTRREDYATSGKAHFELSPEAFSAAERQVLAVLLTGQSVDQYALADYDNGFRRLVMLNAGDFARLVPSLDQLPHFQFILDPDERPYSVLVPTAFDRSAKLFAATCTATASGYRLTITCRQDAMIAEDRVLIVGNHCYQMTVEQYEVASRVLAVLPAQGELQFAAADGAKLDAFLQYFGQIGIVEAPETLAPAALTPLFALDKDDSAIRLTLRFASGDVVVPGSRNRDQARQAEEYLWSLGFVRDGGSWVQAFAGPAQLYFFFVQQLPNLKENGRVTVAPALAALVQDGAELSPQVAVSERRGLLAISFSMAGIQEQEVDAMLSQLAANQPFITRADGRLVLVDPELKAVSTALAHIRQDAQWHAGKLLLPATQTLAVQAALGQHADFDAQFQRLAQDLTHPEDYPLADALAGIQADLRPYQAVGVRWLEMLAAHGFGGILADEMGLGKTLQMISFLHHHRESGVSLVVAPASLLYNWQAEFTKFAPDMTVVVVDGTKAERTALIQAQQADVLITSYNQARLDGAEYAAAALNYLVLDEAQFVKNAGAKTHQVLRKLHPKATFALSGTPIENRTDELWALFALVLPGLLPNKKAFTKLSPEAIAIRVKPFILRREKQAVLQDLPAKNESSLTNEMTRAQKTVYLAQLQQMQVQVQGLARQPLGQHKLEILAGLTRLRQICDTPALYLPDYTGGSGKLEQLQDLLARAAANGRHVLIFSQFTTMLDQLQEQLALHRQPYFVLKGGTKAKARQAMVDAFNAGEKPFFLISLKAGGTGLNLTGADLVILVDLWWNPAVEDQAIARAHRIGQTHQVDVVRLITQGTIEEQIVKLQAQKRDLVDQIMAGTDNKASLSDDDIRLILGLN